MSPDMTGAVDVTREKWDSSWSSSMCADVVWWVGGGWCWWARLTLFADAVSSSTVHAHESFILTPHHRISSSRKDTASRTLDAVMARDSRDASLPTLHKLQQPEKLSTILGDDKAADCLPCRAMGELLDA